jgi:hypothetical protein
MDKHELAAKCDWEGGIPESIFGTGINSSDLPRNAPKAIKQAWKELEDLRPQMQFIASWLWGSD